MTTILLVDDHPLFREGMASAFARLAQDIRILGAETATEGLILLQGDPSIDLVLLDLVLPDMDGVEALGRYASACPHVPRMLISGRHDLATVARARQAGASGFLPKALPVDAMLTALRRVLDGDSVFPDTGQDGSSPRDLTPRQREVLSLLNDGCTNQVIARELDIAERTVRAHITELFQFLGVTSRTQAVIVAQRRGLVSGG